MRSDPRVELVHHFFAGTGDTYDQMVNLWTIGFDLWWKKRILEKIPRTAEGIIDQACGTGILTLKMAQKFPQAQVIGVELRRLCRIDTIGLDLPAAWAGYAAGRDHIAVITVFNQVSL